MKTQRYSGLATALALLLVHGVCARADGPPLTRPNVLFIAVDDLNDWVGCIGGHPDARTPRIDRLAQRGVVFTNAHCQAPLCNPSRTSLLFGLRPSTTGVYGLLPGPRDVAMLRERVSLPQHFRAAGYSTFLAGKVFHDDAIKPADRPKECDVWGPAPGMPLPRRKFVKTPDPMAAMDWGIFPDHDEDQADWKIADATIARLRSLPPGRPFFVACGFRLPHVPCFASRKWFDLFPEDQVTLPPVKDDDRDDIPFFAWYMNWKLPEPRLSWLRKAGQWRPLVRSYLASTAFMDSQVGRVLDALAASGHADDTVVVLWGDNGWHLGQKGVTGKTTLWEPSTHVPLIFAGPGVSAGGRCVEPAELLDIYPTLITLCSLPPIADLEGHSLAPQLKDALTTRVWPAITTHNQGNHTIRTKRWRFIRYADGSEELYDHDADPNEWTNLAGRPEQAATIRNLAQFLPTVNATPVRGSASRVLTQKNGVWMWEGKPIRVEELEK